MRGSDQHHIDGQFLAASAASGGETMGAAAAPPPWITWAHDLTTLLLDEQGAQLFEHFLRSEECGLNELYFLYACNGIEQDEENSEQLEKNVRTIFKHYLKQPREGMRVVSDDVRAAILEVISATDRKQYPITPQIFVKARQQVEDSVRRTTYAEFIKSDIYIDYINEQNEKLLQQEKEEQQQSENEQQQSSCGGALLPSDDELDEPPEKDLSLREWEGEEALKEALLLPPLRPHDRVILDTLDEEESGDQTVRATTQTTTTAATTTSSSHHTTSGTKSAPLTRRNMMNRYVDALPKISKEYRGGVPPNPYHVRGSAYVPPTAVNSELQSISSGAYTDLDVTDCEYGTSRVAQLPQPPQQRYERRTHHRSSRSATYAATRGAPINLHTSDTLPSVLVPKLDALKFRTERADCAEKDPEKFFQLIEPRLRKLHEFQQKHPEASLTDIGKIKVPLSTAPAALNPAAITFEDDAQHIIDQHVDRVFKDAATTVKTPRSPSPSRSNRTLKSPYAMAANPKKINEALYCDSGDSAIVGDYYSSVASLGVGSASAASMSVPQAQPRRGGALAPQTTAPATTMVNVTTFGRDGCSTTTENIAASAAAFPGAAAMLAALDSGTEDAYNPRDRVAQWVAKPHVMNGEKPSKSSTHSGSNRSSDERRKNRSNNNNNGSGTGMNNNNNNVLKNGGPTITIGYRYSGMEYPYVTKLPGTRITLADFKTVLTKKGNFRYFFQHKSNEFGSGIVSEEISDDSAVLPMCEGKIVAEVVEGTHKS